MNQLQNKVAIITGGAGSIGKTTAKLFLEEGAKVLLVDLNESQLKEVQTELANENVAIFAADVSKANEVESYVNEAIKRFGKIDVFFNNAGIAVKIITGDGAETTMAIAKQIQFQGSEKSINGDEIMKLDESALGKCVIETSIFTRMFPEAKLKVINALKSQNQIVAMTGDGVNDGPALKAAHIGIAMGKKGTEIAKQAASLILLEDDLSKMIDAIATGRKIYSNLKKAIQYIISIHIPIILTVFIPLAFGWLYPTLFSPIHIIFLEIIMGPTCSIIYENEPLEKNTMLQAPKALTTTFFKWRELSISIVQGILIAIGTLSVYQYAVLKGYDEALTRTMTFLVLITANILLTLINRSFYYSILTTLSYKNRMIPFIIFTTIAIVSVMLSVPTITTFFEFETPSFSQFTICISVGFVSVSWFEVAKWIQRRRK
ncbi:MAG: SDR family NAD(P)-dependent oxidoreductase [Flavobacteriales bacterium]|nr:SDR family NAD(P)-dependent oxidoreductase [Crocinitomicaceae bacterium]NBX80316.1 SDR family NAD(P)-dependent oxidoreductase [Flavobacteriales bacterium]